MKLSRHYRRDLYILQRGLSRNNHIILHPTIEEWVFRLDYGKQSFNAKDIGGVDWRIEYLNKSLDSLDFNKWEHIDVENSDTE